MRPFTILIFLVATLSSCHSPSDTSVNVPPPLEHWQAPHQQESFNYERSITSNGNTTTPASYTMTCNRVDTISGRLIEHFAGNGYNNYEVMLEVNGDISIGDSVAGIPIRYPTGGGASTLTFADSVAGRVVRYVGTDLMTVLDKKVTCMHVIDSSFVGQSTSIESVNTWFDPELGCAIRTIRHILQTNSGITVKDQTIDEEMVKVVQ